MWEQRLYVVTSCQHLPVSVCIIRLYYFRNIMCFYCSFLLSVVVIFLSEMVLNKSTKTHVPLSNQLLTVGSAVCPTVPWSWSTLYVSKVLTARLSGWVQKPSGGPCTGGKIRMPPPGDCTFSVLLLWTIHVLDLLSTGHCSRWFRYVLSFLLLFFRCISGTEPQGGAVAAYKFKTWPKPGRRFPVERGFKFRWPKFNQTGFILESCLILEPLF